MPHVDDGILHAYLDGALGALADAGALPNGAAAADIEAHFRACADCRARLEAERDVRERAGLVLRDAALPAVDMPPFDHIAARAGGLSSPYAKRRRRSSLPLAWAASLILALGAGLIAGVLLRQDERAPDAAAGEPAPAGGARQDAALAAGQDADPAEPPSTTTAAADAASAPPRTEHAGGAAAGADRIAATGIREPAAAGRAAADAGAAELAAADAVAAEQDTRGAVQELTGRAAARAALGSQPAPLGQPALDAGITHRPLSSRVAVDPGAPGALRLESVAVQAFAAAPPAMKMSDQETEMEQFRAAVQLARTTQAWIALSADDQRRGAVPVPVHDEAVSVEVRAAPAPGGRLVLVQQRLRSGELLEVVAWMPPAQVRDTVIEAGAPLRAPAARARQGPGEPAGPPRLALVEMAAATLPDGRSELVMQDRRAGGWFSISGLLPLERIRELAGRMEDRRGRGPE